VNTEEMRTRFLAILRDAATEAKEGTPEYAAETDAQTDLLKLLSRKDWNHFPQVFAALRMDYTRDHSATYEQRGKSVKKSTLDAYMTAYDTRLDRLEEVMFTVEHGRPHPSALRRQEIAMLEAAEAAKVETA
jgi:hypothetical protein